MYTVRNNALQNHVINKLVFFLFFELAAEETVAFLVD